MYFVEVVRNYKNGRSVLAFRREHQPSLWVWEDVLKWNEELKKEGKSPLFSYTKEPNCLFISTRIPEEMKVTGSKWDVEAKIKWVVVNGKDICLFSVKNFDRV